MGPAHHDEIVRGAVRTLEFALQASCQSYDVAATQLAFLADDGFSDSMLASIATDITSISSDAVIGFTTTQRLVSHPWCWGKSNRLACCEPFTAPRKTRGRTSVQSAPIRRQAMQCIVDDPVWWLPAVRPCSVRVSFAWSISRGFRCRPAAAAARKRCCVGTTPNSARFHRANSFL